VTPRPPSRGPKLFLPHFTRSIVTRSVVAWLFVRAGATVATGLPEAAGPTTNPLQISPVAALYVVGIVAAVGWIGARLVNEDTFLLCLGYGPRRQLAMHAAPALLLETAIWLVGRM
jgi:hypothetical protein